jgi:hypothetical protein
VSFLVELSRQVRALIDAAAVSAAPVPNRERSFDRYVEGAVQVTDVPHVVHKHDGKSRQAATAMDARYSCP